MTSEVIQVLDEFHEFRQPTTNKMERAEIWGRWGGVWCEAMSERNHVDIYEQIQEYAETFRGLPADAPTPDAVAIVTTGWGAPLGADGEPEGAPSQHPERVRLSLVVVVLPSSLLASRITFDMREGRLPVDDEGMATGALAGAVDLMAFHVWKQAFTSALVFRWVDGKGKLPEDELQAIGARVSRFVDAFSDDEEGVSL
jgi:hypothetical protein